MSHGLGNTVWSLVNEMEKRGHECTVCSLVGPDIKLGNRFLVEKFGGLGGVYFWIQVSRYLRKHCANYDMVWFHQPVLLFPATSVPSVATFHTTYHGYMRSEFAESIPKWSRIYYSLMKRIELHSVRTLIHQKTAFTHVGPAQNRELTEIGVPSRSSVYIPNGVDISKFRPCHSKEDLRNEFQIPPGKTVFLWVGRLTYQKQPHRAIRIISRLSNYIDDVYLLMVGAGELQNSILHLTKLMDQENFRYLGYVSDEDLVKLYQLADYFLLSSNYEGFPLTVLEAMASGLPSFIPEIPNLSAFDVNDGGVFCVDMHNVDYAVSLVRQHLTRLDQHVESEKAREWAAKNFSWGKICEKYLHLFRHVLQP